MNKLEYKFFKEDKVNWKRKLDQSVLIIERTLNGEYDDLVLTLSPFKRTKTTEQLRAIYKLFQLALPHFQEWMPNLVWDEELIKEFAKTELGYTREPTKFEIAIMIKAMESKIVREGGSKLTEKERDDAKQVCKKIEQNVSFADFTKEELYNFTREFEVWALSKGWDDVFLDDGEKKSLFGFNN